jgi:transcriptional regulator with XRE-family HTH domain
MTANTGERDERRLRFGTPTGAVPADTFAVRLVLVRHHAGRASIEQAAKRCGLNPGNWAHWEDGRQPRDRVDIAQKISDALDVDFEWLLLGGPLTGARGRPVDHPATREYPDRANGKPKDTRPTGRASAPSGPQSRRPRRLTSPITAEMRETQPVTGAIRGGGESGRSERSGQYQSTGRAA